MKPSIETWHGCLGHLATSIVQRVLRESNLPCLVQEEKDCVCDACQ
jgi:hypothetical protein